MGDIHVVVFGVQLYSCRDANVDMLVGELHGEKGGY